VRRRDNIHAEVRSHPCPALAPFGQSLSAPLALPLVTTLYNNDSHLFSILLNPSPPALVMLQALGRLTALRMGSRPRGTLSRELSTIGRPLAPLGRVLPVEGQIMS
jgi:hypothetical protein